MAGQEYPVVRKFDISDEACRAFGFNFPSVTSTEKNMQSSVWVGQQQVVNLANSTLSACGLTKKALVEHKGFESATAVL